MVATWACEVTEISHKEAVKKPLLCEDYSDLTSPTSNHIHMTIFKNSFSRMRLNIV